MTFHPLSSLLDKCTLLLPMKDAFPCKDDDTHTCTNTSMIKMDPDDDKDPVPRDKEPIVSEEEHLSRTQDMSRLVKDAVRFWKFTGKNGGGFSTEERKKMWNEQSARMRSTLASPPFFQLLDSMVDDLDASSSPLLVFLTEGDNQDCPWTESLLAAYKYYVDKGFRVLVLFCKAKPTWKLYNPSFQTDWRRSVCDSVSLERWESDFYFANIGDDDPPKDAPSDISAWKEVWTTLVSHVVVNVGSNIPCLRLNEQGNETAGYKLIKSLLDEVKDKEYRVETVGEDGLLTAVWRV